MQDKIHSSQNISPVISSKTPPLSSLGLVNNITHYYQLKSQSEVLSTLVGFLQGKANKKLAKAKRGSGVANLQFAYAEEKGTAQEIGKAMTSNTLQDHLGAQIELTRRLIAILKTGGVKGLESDTKKLDSLVASFPNLSSQQIESLNSMTDKLNALSSNAPIKTQMEYREEMIHGHVNIYKNHLAVLTKLDNIGAGNTSAPPEQVAGAHLAQQNLAPLTGALQKAPSLGAAQGTARGATQKEEQNSDSGKSLPDLMIESLMKSYKRAQAYFFELGAMLEFDNMGAEFGNKILGQFTNFANASVNYSFGPFTKTSIPNNYTGDYATVKAKYDKELASANADLGTITSTINNINDELDKIEHSSASPDKKESMKNELKRKLPNLIKTRAQLQDLIKSLNKITITKGVTDLEVYITSSDPNSNWQEDISKGERIVVMGDTTAADGVKGGLNNVKADMEDFEQGYSDQGQNMQMQLQMHMTVLNQINTLDASMFTTWNQCMMTVAQNIK